MTFLNTLQSNLALGFPGSIGHVVCCASDTKSLKMVEHFLESMQTLRYLTVSSS